MIRRIAFTSCCLLALTDAGFAECVENRLDLRGSWGSARFDVEIADTDAERARGLMFRETLPRSAGMLFLYDSPEPLSFWMRNTFIPLDLLFLDTTGTVVTIHENAIPFDETPLSGGADPLLAVLEINGGMVELLGIRVGSQIRHPGLPQDVAAWPCD